MNAVSRFPIPELDTLPEDVRSRIVAVHEKAGFIPNVFLAWAHRPEEFRAWSLMGLFLGGRRSTLRPIAHHTTTGSW